jgi:hypothetical protein
MEYGVAKLNMDHEIKTMRHLTSESGLHFRLAPYSLSKSNPFISSLHSCVTELSEQNTKIVDATSDQPNQKSAYFEKKRPICGKIIIPYQTPAN